MNLVLDHIVHFIHQHPSTAVEKWKELGIHAVIGGSHENWGTFNSLLYVGDAYIEYLAIENMATAAKSDNPLITQFVNDLANGNGLGQICLRTNDILHLKEQLEAKGCKTYPIFNGSRKRQDGSMIKWRMLFIKNQSSLPYPFFIEWEQEDALRMQNLKSLGYLDERLAKHSIHSIQIAVYDCESKAKEWADLFDFCLTDIHIDEHAACKKAILKGESLEVHFCQPIREDDPLHNTLIKRGERPFGIIFEPPLDGNFFNLFDAQYK